jgi:hypothetical protein
MKAGAYREPLKRGAYILGISLPEDLRLALTNQEMVGVQVRADLKSEVICCLRVMEKEFPAEVKHYCRQLEEGGVVPIVPLSGGTQTMWAPGELFLKS